MGLHATTTLEFDIQFTARLDLDTVDPIVAPAPDGPTNVAMAETAFGASIATFTAPTAKTNS